MINRAIIEAKLPNGEVIDIVIERTQYDLGDVRLRLERDVDRQTVIRYFETAKEAS